MSGGIIADIGGVLMLEMGVQQQFFPAIRVDVIDVTHPFADEKIAIADLFDAIAAIGQIGNVPQLFSRIGEEHFFVRQDIEPIFGRLETVGSIEVVHVKGRDVFFDAIDLAGLRVGNIDDACRIDCDVIQTGGAGDIDLFEDMLFVI